jgi:hypothetical protein
MKLVKFNDFVKNRINEDIEPIENPMEKSPELEAGIEATEDMEGEDPSNIIDEPSVEEEEYEEEESGEYQGTTNMKELAEALGTEVVNNEISYQGHKIQWFSETESFHVDRNKKFETIEEVISYLEGDHGHTHSHVPSKEELEPALESRRFRRTKRK